MTNMKNNANMSEYVLFHHQKYQINEWYSSMAQWYTHVKALRILRKDPLYFMLVTVKNNIILKSYYPTGIKQYEIQNADMEYSIPNAFSHKI